MNRTFILALAVLLSACSTSIKYTVWDGKTEVPSTALKFSLQDSLVTLSAPKEDKDSTNKEKAKPREANAASASADVKSTDNKEDPAKATVEPLVKQNCPAAVTEEKWWGCFNRVKASSVMAMAEDSPIYIAMPSDARNLYFTTTTITGKLAPGEDTLYTQISMTYKNNAGTIITDAGTGAVTGFGVAGPYGALAGFVIGGALSAGTDKGANTTHLDAPFVLPGFIPLDPFLCEKSKSKISFINPTGPALAPALFLPLSIAGADARPISTSSSLPVANNADSKTCWNLLPNTGFLNDELSEPLKAGESPATTIRPAQLGDGWIYRFVSENPAATTQKNLGGETTTTTDFFSSNTEQKGFPYSSCRKVLMQVTWWTEVTKTENQPRVITFKTSLADPEQVNTASLDKGGVINFKADCGANVSTTADTSNIATINAAMTAAKSIYDAQKAWKKSKESPAGAAQ